MYIEFNLTLSRHEFSIKLINYELDSWAAQHNTHYTGHLKDKSYIGLLADDAMYSFFGLSWKTVYRTTKRFKIIDTELPKDFTKEYENV